MAGSDRRQSLAEAAAMDDNDWFRRRALTDTLACYDEPFVHGFFRANMFHLRGHDRDLLVDTGMGLARLSQAIAADPGKPLFALATHIHVDHVGSLNEFAERAGPATSASAFAVMDDALTYADMYRVLVEPVSRAPAPNWKVDAYQIKPAPLTVLLGEGDIVDLGDRQFRVLQLPGHSPDSIGLFDERDGLFFSGDAIYDDTLIDDLPDSDRTAYRATMARILDLPVRIAHGGHGESFSGERMRQIARRYIEGSEA
jgi:glyoxylase-like metal-dependent hydrolase (beta-lactamase superfamily II)